MSFGKSLLLTDDYLRVRQGLTRKADSLDQQIAEVTVKLHESEAAADDGIRDAVATMKKYCSEQELTKEIVDVFIDRILIYDPKHIEIQWKLPDEVIKFACKAHPITQKQSCQSIPGNENWAHPA